MFTLTNGINLQIQQFLNKESVLQNINYDYTLSFGRDNKLYPFKNLFDTDNINDKKYFVNFLKDINFYYTPQNINFSSSYVDSDNLTVQRDLYGGIITDERNIDLNEAYHLILISLIIYHSNIQLI